MDLDLDGDTAVVMASTSGLGYGVARAFVREGANVVVNGRDETKLDAARTELESMSTGGGVAAVAADLTDPAAATELVTARVRRPCSEWRASTWVASAWICSMASVEGQPVSAAM